MQRLSNRHLIQDFLLGCSLLVSFIALIRWPEISSSAVRDGLTLCYSVLIPSLFPFFVLSALMIKLGLSRYLGQLLAKVMPPLFRVNGACATALVLGLIGGYPVGASTAITLYQNGQCSKTEGERLLAFCNNSGPAFIFGVVGAGIFASSHIGLLLYLGHISSALFIGILFRFYKPNDDIFIPTRLHSFQVVSFPQAFTQSITSALSSVLNISAFVLFFTVLIRMCTECRLIPILSSLLEHLGIPAVWTEPLFIGFLELSSGVSSLRSIPVGVSAIALSAFMLSWAGLSIHCQVLSCLGDCDLSIRTYFIGKVLHSFLSTIITTLLIALSPIQLSTISVLNHNFTLLPSMTFYRSLSVSFAVLLLIMISLFLRFTNKTKKRVEKPHKKVYTVSNKP